MRVNMVNQARKLLLQVQLFPSDSAESLSKRSIRATRKLAMILRHLPLLAALTSLIVACGGTEPKVSTPSTEKAPDNTQSVAAIDPKPDDNPTRGNIRIANDVLKSCGLADDSAYFAFDSAHVEDKDKKRLGALANCFESGPLKGRQMSLVGHADPRGDGDYNLALGGRRADNVKILVVAENMSASKVSTTSRGEMDATGTDELSWAKDRTVDVKLGH
jgi:peptidoglycan-associated lipoprotein